jgi:hypothetical protein
MNKEEALAKLKNKLPWLNKETVEAIETLIPEIAETEDEKIRKEIINFLISTKDVPNDQIETIDKWIDWLGHPGEGKTKTDAIKAAAEEITKDKNKTIAFLKEAGIMDKNGRLAEMYRIEDPDAYSHDNGHSDRRRIEGQNDPPEGFHFISNQFCQHLYTSLK